MRRVAERKRALYSNYFALRLSFVGQATIAPRLACRSSLRSAPARALTVIPWKTVMNRRVGLALASMRRIRMTVPRTFL